MCSRILFSIRFPIFRLRLLLSSSMQCSHCHCVVAAFLFLCICADVCYSGFYYLFGRLCTSWIRVAKCFLCSCELLCAVSLILISSLMRFRWFYVLLMLLLLRPPLTPPRLRQLPLQPSPLLLSITFVIVAGNLTVVDDVGFHCCVYRDVHHHAG